MNKYELISAVAKKTGYTRKETEAVVESILEAITDELAANGCVRLSRFGKFETKHKPAHFARNPKTMEKVFVSDSKVPVFKAGIDLKLAVSKAPKNN